jgi:hypothetical protein
MVFIHGFQKTFRKSGQAGSESSSGSVVRPTHSSSYKQSTPASRYTARRLMSSIAPGVSGEHGCQPSPGDLVAHHPLARHSAAPGHSPAQASAHGSWPSQSQRRRCVKQTEQRSTSHRSLWHSPIFVPQSGQKGRRRRCFGCLARRLEIFWALFFLSFPRRRRLWLVGQGLRHIFARRAEQSESTRIPEGFSVEYCHSPRRVMRVLAMDAKAPLSFTRNS